MLFFFTLGNSRLWESCGVNWPIPSPDLGLCSTNKPWFSAVLPQCGSFLCRSSSTSSSLGRAEPALPSAQPLSSCVWLSRQFPKSGPFGCTPSQGQVHCALGRWLHPTPREESCWGGGEAVAGWFCSVLSAEQGCALQGSICSSVSRVIFSSEHVSVVWCWYEPLQLAPHSIPVVVRIPTAENCLG